MPGFDLPLDLRAYAPGEWLVLTALTYRANYGRAFLTPRGYITDLASIPRLLRPALDYLYSRKITRRADADLLFLEAMEHDGVSWLERTVLYAGVRAFGWTHWRTRSDGLRPDDFAEVTDGAA